MSVKVSVILLLILLSAPVWKSVEFGITLRDMLQEKDVSTGDVILDAVGVAIYSSFFTICSLTLRKADKRNSERKVDKPNEGKE